MDNTVYSYLLIFLGISLLVLVLSRCGVKSEKYSDSGFWSLYGWRTLPPWRYPQQTINTPFDLEMKACSGWCSQTQDPEKCLRKCHFRALKATGLKVPPNLYDTPNRSILDLKPPLSDPLQIRFAKEGFSSVSRSLPSHTSRAHRLASTEGESEIPAHSEIPNAFCFYR